VVENETETRSLEARMLRAAKLEAGLYDEVKTDTTANRQAFLVVVISGVAESLALALGIRLGDDLWNS
jgi:hypothetical protein